MDLLEVSIKEVLGVTVLVAAEEADITEVEEDQITTEKVEEEEVGLVIWEAVLLVPVAPSLGPPERRIVIQVQLLQMRWNQLVG